jgi:hypothetical protein
MLDHEERTQGRSQSSLKPVNEYIARYDPETNRCYVKFTTTWPPDNGWEMVGTDLRDGQTNELLADTGKLTKDNKTTEWGHIGAEAPAYGHTEYMRVQAFIDDHVREK